MEHRSLINSIFGKETGITEGDIEARILGNFKESALIDYKRVDGRNFEQGEGITKAEIRALIMPELVAFLNKMTPEGGILVLGINAKAKIPTEITGVDEELIKNDSALRDWIINDISSIPPCLDFPTIEIETVSLGDNKKVYFIEVRPKDLNVLYFNTIDSKAYVREADTRRELSLEESVRIINIKKTAKLYANLELIDLRIDSDFVSCKVKVVFENSGNKPASNILGMFLFKIDGRGNGCDKAEISFFDTKNIHETSNINVCFKSFQQDFKQLFYPKRPVVVGFFDIRFLQTAPILLTLEIDEENGRTNQVFGFSESGIKKILQNFSSY